MTTPAGYRHHTQISIRYGDLDRLSHVNNAKYFTYIEQGRISYFRDTGLWDGGLGEAGMIVGRVTIEYQLPLAMDDGPVDVWTRCVRLGNKSLDIESLVLRSHDAAIAATGLTVVVAYNYRAQATIPIPDSWRQLVADYEPAWK